MGIRWLQQLGKTARRARWRDRISRIATMSPAELRRWRAEARAQRHEAGQFLTLAEQRLARLSADAAPRLPGRPDVVWRPALWRAAILPAAHVGAAGGPLDAEVGFFHDCPLKQSIVRQVRNDGDAAHPPYGLSVEVFGFRGSYFSLSCGLPLPEFAGTGARHVIAVRAEVEGAVALGARLNILHGPDKAEVMAGMRRDGALAEAEFGLGAMDLNERRIERIWLDIFLQDPGMSRVVLRDLVLSRRLLAGF